MAANPQQLQKVQDPGPHVRKYGAYQNEVYAAGMMHGIKPMVTKDPNKLEAQAKATMSAASYAYVAGAAGERATLDANRLAFRQWKLVPRMLRQTTHRDLKTTLFGVEYETPVLCAPVGVQKIFNNDGETGVAEVMASIGIPYIASTASSESIEDIAQANDKGAGGDGQRWYQLYWPQDKEITESLLNRAKSLNYKVLVVTLDTWALAWRPWDLDLAYVPFFTGVGNATGFSDPVFRRKFKERNGKEVEDDILLASREWIADVFSGAAHTWEELAHLRANWDGPIVCKGIQDPGDALKALECGMDGIVVSNHGGRQLDGAVGSLEMLPEIVEAVGDRKTVGGEKFHILFDSGIRTGVDIIKALSLGAHAVLIGRPWVYGLGIGGKRGAKHAMQGLLADLDQSMGLSGIRTIADMSKDRLRRCNYGGDRNSNN